MKQCIFYLWDGAPISSTNQPPKKFTKKGDTDTARFRRAMAKAKNDRKRKEAEAKSRKKKDDE